MTLPRPDLAGISPEVQAYIESLEADLERLARPVRSARPDRSDEIEEPPSEPSEPPTTFNLITVSAGGWIKRTPRHLYDRQRRGGMGIFDLDVPEEDAPAFLVNADIGQALVLVTSQGRAFPLPVSQLAEAPIRARGEALSPIPFMPGERLAAVFPAQESGYLILVTVRGQVRRLRYHYFGKNLQPGTILYDVREGGAPAAFCWSAGDGGDLFIATATGNGIRFAESQVPVRGCLGIRVHPDDAVVGVASVREESGVFLLSNDGKGTIRQMAGFSKNKEPGSGGKVAMKADRLIGAALVGEGDDIFVISRLSKIIRFSADEVPAKEGVVQGVNCMALRADECTALAVCTMSF